MSEIKKEKITRAPVFIISGEPSGDALGGELMKHLKSLRHELSFAGIGGKHMRAQGLRSLFPIEDLSLVGLGEILPHKPKLLKRLNQTVDAIKKTLPDVVVTIDSPDFSFRLGKRLKQDSLTKNIPIVHYVAPAVWAWREGRSKKIAKVVNHLMTLFPFEAKYFKQHGLKTTFVGHPIFDKEPVRPNSLKVFKNRHKIQGGPSLCLLPGSRKSEIMKLMPIYLKTIRLLEDKYPKLSLIIPIVPRTKLWVKRFLNQLKTPYCLVTDPSQKDLAIKSSDIALATSGTISLELSFLRKAHVVAYKLNSITFRAIKLFAKVNFVTIINIVARREIIPEFLQEKCQPNRLFSALDSLISDKITKSQQISSIVDILKKIKKNKKPASFNAAQVVLKYCK